MRLVRIAVALALVVPAMAEPPSLDRAFRHMYDLHFAAARTEIAAYQVKHPDEPMPHVADASALLFSEFERLRILQTEFFATDKKFDSREKRSPDAKIKQEFETTLKSAETKAKALLAKDAKHKDALFALALLNGLRADYAALIEKRDFPALGYTKSATQYAEQLLAIAPDYYDAYLATGLGKYIIGTKPAPVRWILRLGGFKGDVDSGMADLKITAEKGRYLAPFAKLLLAVGYIRTQRRSEAKQILAALRDEFPHNPLFAQEVAQLEK
jgi:hypothetical protein